MIFKSDNFRGRIILEIINTRFFRCCCIATWACSSAPPRTGWPQAPSAFLRSTSRATFARSANNHVSLVHQHVIHHQDDKICISIAAPSLSSSYRQWSPGRRRDPPRCLGQWSSQSAARRSPTRSGCWGLGIRSDFVCLIEKTDNPAFSSYECWGFGVKITLFIL